MAEQMTDAELRQQIAHWTRAALGPMMEDDGLLAGSFPDAHFLIEDHIAESDKVVPHWRARATHQGPFKGMAPTGKPVSVRGITILCIVDGKIADRHAQGDEMLVSPVHGQCSNDPKAQGKQQDKNVGSWTHNPQLPQFP